MSSAISERMSLEIGLRRAIERGELLLHYQPQFELQSGRLIGAEALLRWNSKEQGMISPAQFIPIAEETGLIVSIGQWVLEEACRPLDAWREAGYSLERVAVNVSGLQIHRSDFTATVRNTLDSTRLEPAALELEVTESVVMHQAEVAIDTLTALSSMGITLAIDDFGTG